MAAELEFKDEDKKLLYTINLGIFAIDKSEELKKIFDDIKSPAKVKEVITSIEDLYKTSDTTDFTKVSDTKGTITAKKETTNGLDIVENETLASQNEAIAEMRDVILANVFVTEKPEDKEVKAKESDKDKDIDKEKVPAEKDFKNKKSDEDKEEVDNKPIFEKDPVGSYLKNLKGEDPLSVKPVDKMAKDKVKKKIDDEIEESE